jgi:hypothetical protein
MSVWCTDRPCRTPRRAPPRADRELVAHERRPTSCMSLWPAVTATASPATVEGAAAASGGAGGWMLLALDGQRRHWSMPLLSRGAAVTAPPRVAQAVAVRVLTELGVYVRAWHGAGSADEDMYRAELKATPEPAPRRSARRGGDTVRLVPS